MGWYKSGVVQWQTKLGLRMGKALRKIDFFRFFWRSKTRQKKGCSKNRLFPEISAILAPPTSIFDHFGSQNGFPESTFSVFFRKRRFCQNCTPATAGASFSRVGLSKNRSGERLRTAPAKKNDKNRFRRRLRTHFFGPGPVFCRFWPPGRVPK